MKKILIASFLITFLVIIYIFSSSGSKTTNQNNTPPESTDAQSIRYMPIGDSYTIGNGVNEQDRWPNLLVKHLNEQGINVKLISNPAVSGYTVEDAITYELPEFKRAKPDFATLFIGANDNFSDADKEMFRKRLRYLIDEMQKSLTNPQNLVLITLPDYSKTPAARGYSRSSSVSPQELNSISASVRAYNSVIIEEGQKRGLKVVDLYPVSQTMTSADLFIYDGLHPNAKGIALWEKEIYPVVLSLLK